jgi:membrane protein DedA with SNARE-associated domain
MNTIGPFAIASAAFAGTFVSEDLTCIAVGLLAASGQAGLAAGLAGCFLGIFVSDAALWLVGRVAGRRILNWRWVRRKLPPERLARLEQWLNRNAGGAVLAARFLPGVRLPMYVAAGMLGRNGGRFLFWTFVAALVWTPLIVLSVATFGEALAGPLRRILGSGGPAVLLMAAAAFLTIRTATRLTTRTGRAKLAATIARVRRWEFWPAWLFYLPLVPWYLWLGARYRSFTAWTAANPAIPAGGIVGESKAEILAQLPQSVIIPSAVIPQGELKNRLRDVRREIANRGWEFPLVLKPDASQRGAGVKKAHDMVDVEKYLQRQPAAVLVQPYHPGPFEAGIFYYRIPGDTSGRIFSVTDKEFPAVVGNGVSTLVELIWAHPRYRMQADVFLTRFAGITDHVLRPGERLPLALAGNHCQGTMLRDGSHLITPELERAVDDIAKTVPGFFIGRFDIRYTDVEKLRTGTGFAIVELNGATSESTNLYDPSWSLPRAYATLFRQWALLFRIGHANRRRGHSALTLRELFRLLRHYYRDRTIDPLAD